MSKFTSSTTQNSDQTRRLFKEDKENEKINELQQDNNKLKGEISILRQNMLNLEKQNYELREEKSKSMQLTFTSNDKLKREVSALHLQNKIHENKMMAFKRKKIEYSMDIKWALQQSDSDLNFSLFPFEYKRLKFFKDFFFHDFCQFPSEEIIEEIKKRLNNYKEFMDFYGLFCCKVDVFKEFFMYLFINDYYIDKKVEVFNSVPLEWILGASDDSNLGNIRRFVSKAPQEMLNFLIKVTKERPFILNLILDKSTFNDLISLKTYPTKLFLDLICKNNVCGFIDHTNLHYLTEENLKDVYKDEYKKTEFMS